VAVEDAVLGLERLAAGTSDRIEGEVRVSAPPAFASRWLVPRLVPLRRAHPALTLDVVGEHGVASLVRRDADVALRLLRPEGDGLVTRRLGVLRFGLYGARGYVERTDPSDHELLGYDAHLAHVPQQRWIEAHAAGRPFALRCNDLDALIRGAEAGLGLAVVPHVLAGTAADLVCVADAPEASRDLWLVVHPDLRRSARVAAVVDHLVAITSELAT
jgi:DNA-binding transcriptional LysR family regulator